MNFSTACVTNVTFLEVGNNRDTYQQASENNPDEFRNARNSKDIALRIC